MYEARTHGSVRGMMLDLIIQHHPTRFVSVVHFILAEGIEKKNRSARNRIFGDYWNYKLRNKEFITYNFGL